MQNTHLVIIDPQRDFCSPDGALFVPGAEEDIVRLVRFIKRVGDKLSAIHVTLDSHHLIDVAHPIFWQDEKGQNPNPFTIISADDVRNGVWRTAKPSLQKRATDYVEHLEKNGRYPLCVWPPHCLIGSAGYGVMPHLFEVLKDWERNRFRTVDYVTKGSNPFTEHYSAVQADVPDPTDPSTQLNTRLVQVLQDADEILVAGEAGSHCLANTVTDIADAFGNDSYVSKITLLEDGTSPVPTFEKYQDQFVQAMIARGMKVTQTTAWMSSQPVGA